MKNMTFKDFLAERTDVGDLYFQKKRKSEVEAQIAANQTTGEYETKMKKTRGPQKGDVIKHGKVTLVVNGPTKDGIKATQLGAGKKVIVIPFSRKFKTAGTTELGKTIYSPV